MDVYGLRDPAGRRRRVETVTDPRARQSALRAAERSVRAELAICLAPNHDEFHCEHWYDGEVCCACNAPAQLTEDDMSQKIETAIARLAHEVNRAYCAAIGDHSQVAWDEAPDWQKDSARNGVRFTLTHPDATPEESHKSWLAQKCAEGWKYGPVKDVEKKEHPCYVPYEQLPVEQRAKDHLFQAVVRNAQAIFFDV